jgi:hypothetical protein
MAVTTIDVKELPEPVARAIDAMVEALRRQYAPKTGAPRPQEAPPLPTWRGRAALSVVRPAPYF